MGGIRLVNVTSRYNGKDGFNLYDGSDVSMENCLAEGNGRHGVFVHKPEFSPHVNNGAIPDQLYIEFLKYLIDQEGVINEKSIARSASNTPLGNWFAEHSIELAAFVLDFYDKFKDVDAVNALLFSLGYK